MEYLVDRFHVPEVIEGEGEHCLWTSRLINPGATSRQTNPGCMLSRLIIDVKSNVSFVTST
jgi:hypothetical protein